MAGLVGQQELPQPGNLPRLLRDGEDAACAGLKSTILPDDDLLVLNYPAKQDFSTKKASRVKNLDWTS